MMLLRLYAATAFLRGAGFVAGVIAGPDRRQSEEKVTASYLLSTTPKASDSKASNPETGDLGTTPAGYILLASLTGLAICIVWIWINGRAWR
jgi:hypothetical protein